MKTLRVALVAAVCAAACGRGDAPPAGVGAPAPAFAALDLEGKPVSLAQLRGKVVVLNEWATWCGPCKDEIPQLEALHEQYGSKGLALVGVSVDAFGTGADVSDFMRDHGMTYTVWLDPDKKFAVQFLTIGVPSTVVVDRAGVVRYRLIGALRAGDSSLVVAVRNALGAS